MAIEVFFVICVLSLNDLYSQSKDQLKKEKEQLEQEIKERDKKDSERKIAPLKKAHDAIELVSDGMNIEDVLKEMTYIFRSKIPEEVWPTPNS